MVPSGDKILIFFPRNNAFLMFHTQSSIINDCISLLEKFSVKFISSTTRSEKKNEKKESRKTHQKKRAEIWNRVKVFDKQKT